MFKKKEFKLTLVEKLIVKDHLLLVFPRSPNLTDSYLLLKETHIFWSGCVLTGSTTCTGEAARLCAQPDTKPGDTGADVGIENPPSPFWHFSI